MEAELARIIAIVGLIFIITFIIDEWNELRNLQKTIVEEFETRIIYAIIASSIAVLLAPVIAPYINFDLVDVVIGAVFAAFAWPLTKMIERRYFD